MCFPGVLGRSSSTGGPPEGPRTNRGAGFEVRFPPAHPGGPSYRGRVVQLTDVVIVPVPSDAIDRARAAAAPPSAPPVARVTATGGEPLRCCLTNAAAGDALILFNYEPVLPPSPYQERGAVFAHATPCHATLDPRAYPAEWLGRPQVLRAYDERGWIHSASVHDGTSPGAAIRAAFSDPAVVEVHSRNVAYGCFMFSMRRAAT